MQEIIFTKICGAGNDFLIIDSRCVEHNKDQWISVVASIKKQISKLCDRKFGLGADGICLLTLSPNKEVSLLWDFFNNDGSSADMCGNAACCIIDYTYQTKLTSSTTLTFQIKDKILKGEIKDQKPWLQTQEPRWVKKNISKTIDQETFQMDLVDSGVKHLLIQTPGIQNTEKLTPVAKALRTQYPDTNVTFYHPLKDKVESVSYERGVEGFTLACGTGALAVTFKVKNVNNVHMPGGTLITSFKDGQAYLHSPVHWIGKMTPFFINKPS